MRSWVLDVLVGGIVGAICGAILAVNISIFSGVENGYEATIADIFRHNRLVGVITVLVLAAGPVAGVIVARLRRSRLADPQPPARTGRGGSRS